MPSDEEIEALRRSVRGWLGGREILDEIRNSEFHFLYIFRQGTYKLSVHLKTQRPDRLVVQYHGIFPAELLGRISDAFPSGQEYTGFVHGLVLVLARPGFSWAVEEDQVGRVTGFLVWRILFPFDEGPSRQALEDAITNAAQAGPLAKIYVGDLLNVEEGEVQIQSDPGQMFK